jgi:hypothetical protein
MTSPGALDGSALGLLVSVAAGFKPALAQQTQFVRNVQNRQLAKFVGTACRGGLMDQHHALRLLIQGGFETRPYKMQTPAR